MSRIDVKESHRKFLILSAVLPKQAFISSVLVIFYMGHLGISFSEYLILDAVLFISVALTELPSGYISDYFGRKKC